MEFKGFGNYSGPGTATRPANPTLIFPQPDSPSPPLPRLPVDSHMRWGDVKTYKRPPELHPRAAFSNPRTSSPIKTAQVQDFNLTRSPQVPGNGEFSNSSIESGKGYSLPHGARSPPLPFQNSLYFGDQHLGSQRKRPSLSYPVGIHQTKSRDNINMSSEQETRSRVLTTDGTRISQLFPTHSAEVSLSKRTRSPTFTPVRSASPQHTPLASDGRRKSPIDYRDLDAPEEMTPLPMPSHRSFSTRDSSRHSPVTEISMSSPLRMNHLNTSGNNTLMSKGSLHAFSTKEISYPSEPAVRQKHSDALLPKRTRSPTFSSTSGSFAEDPVFSSSHHGRESDSQGHVDSVQANDFKIIVSQPLNFPVVKKAKLPFLSSSDHGSQEKSNSSDIEREIQSKAKRMARFKDELNQTFQNTSSFRNEKFATKKQHQFVSDRPKPNEDPGMDMEPDLVDHNRIIDLEGVTSSGIIIGSCPDMCPESERAERERKGDLDQYERLDGDRNLTSKHLAVKKYTRTAEREAELIRPMPILQKTMDYLLRLLDRPYGDQLLGLYNFLWDRMRAIRLDLRMQHIFDLQAINMLEQMIRLHILAMHELCGYPKGEGFSEGFDAHLNIEQMNKTSVELFQYYDDHRKKGILIPSEREFRGYYALLKLDKHPGYKVEPAELSLDLAKMATEMRQSPEVLFARDVARACRTGNFIAFFRLAKRARYLQACLMHAHFSKLRSQALASLHSGLQINQGIPVSQVAKWLGMEEENIEDLLEYYGFSVKDFEEPYMVKDTALTNVDSDYPLRCSGLVVRKRSVKIMCDVSSPSVESNVAVELNGFQRNGIPKQESTSFQLAVPESISHTRELVYDTNLIYKGNVPSPIHKPSTESIPQMLQNRSFENRSLSTNPSASFLRNSSSESYGFKYENEQKKGIDLDPILRNSFDKKIERDIELLPPVVIERDGGNNLAVLPVDSVMNSPLSITMMVDEFSENEDQTGDTEDQWNDAETNYYEKVIAEAKLKLILRIWKRRTAKKKEFREHKRVEANAALSSLSLGPPLQHYEVQSNIYGMFDIDHITRMRREIQGRSWKPLNPSNVIAAKLIKKNPDAKCLCWKLVLCSQENAYKGDFGLKNGALLSAAGSWLHSKFITVDNDGDSDLLVSSPDLAIWRSWIHYQYSLNRVCCLSAIKSITFQDLNTAVTGASAILFLLSETTSLELQKNHLQKFAMSIPQGSCLPLLILSGTCEDESNRSTIVQDLGLHHIDKSRIGTYSIFFLKDQHSKQVDGFFSDECLREGLEWLASESPPQIGIHSIKTRDLILSRLNPTLDIFNTMNANAVSPNHCIAAFNDALDRSSEAVVSTALANPTCWPCPEIDLLEKSSDEYRAATCYLPSRGWSAHTRIETFVSTLNVFKLPIWQDDFSWLSRGFKIGDDVESQITRLENCLVAYLVKSNPMMGVSLAEKEASTILQKCACLELHNSTHYIVPNWVKIFRRIFSWRLMNLTTRDMSSMYVMVHDPPAEIVKTSEPKDLALLLPTYIDYPSLDELVEVGCRTHDSVPVESRSFEAVSPMACIEYNAQASTGRAILRENEKRSSQNESMVTNFDHSMTAVTTHRNETADRLSELLEKCTVIQTKIDKRLSLYF